MDVPTSKLAVGSGRHSECCRSCQRLYISLSSKEMRQKKLSEEYIRLHRCLSRSFDNIICIEHDSATFSFDPLGKKFDLIYIDGDH